MTEACDLAKGALPTKAVRKDHPQIYWVAPPHHKNFFDNYGRTKLANVLESAIKLFDNIRLIRMKEFWRGPPGPGQGLGGAPQVKVRVKVWGAPWSRSRGAPQVKVWGAPCQGPGQGLGGPLSRSRSRSGRGPPRSRSKSRSGGPPGQDPGGPPGQGLGGPPGPGQGPGRALQVIVWRAPRSEGSPRSRSGSRSGGPSLV